MNYLCLLLSLFGIFASYPLTVLTFCHDSAIEEQALMALAASKVET
jgi:hypothetical protein